VLDDARKRINSGLGLLERVTEIQPTIERENLCGSAWKRLAQVEAAAGQQDQADIAIKNMRLRYARAEARARKTGDPDLFYPTMNSLAAELVVDAGTPGWRGFDSRRLTDVRERLKSKAHVDPDFWSVVGLTELQLYEAVARGDVAGVRESLEREFRLLHDRVVAKWMWASVRDQQQWVLSNYLTRAPAAEQEACVALLNLLGGFARPGGAP
jgi:hypothetical protein